jgi:polyhydroxybutyrate depolymerase
MKWLTAFLTLIILGGAVHVVRNKANTTTPAATTAPASKYPAGKSLESITVGGLTRTYIVYVPQAPANTLMPLVVMLHGGLGTAAQAEKSYGWDQIADANKAVIIYPDGVDKTWNAGTCCGQAAAKNVDDVQFINKIIDVTAQNVPIDTKRVYATGISNGGMMVYRLACELPNVFAAVGPDSASMTVGCTNPAPQPISVLHIHGLADQNVPFAGGAGTKGFAKDSRPSVPSVIDFWRTLDKCSPAASSKAGLVTTSIASCPNNLSVGLITIDGAGHQWPGSVAEGPVISKLLGLDPPSTALNATQTFWNFFSQHSL